MTDSAALSNKKIVLVVTGGIAAYKSAELARLLIKQGAEVQVVMTEGARAFITPMTFQALTGRSVRQDLLDPAAEQGMGHIELARWGDLVLVAPATADAIARVANGLANDLFSTIALARRSALALAPAMNQAMWRNPMTQRNLAILREHDPDTHIWGPAEGDQACGDTGPGRMLEPEEIVRRVIGFFSEKDATEHSHTTQQISLSEAHVVITAGPTRERLDPVRYISNDSSGKMGFALAAAFRAAGARVTLISGPVALPAPEGIEVVAVESALQMHAAAMAAVSEGCDIFVATAAVADYRPAEKADQKIKKGEQNRSIELIRNPDIVADVAGLDTAPYCVGFAAETSQVVEYARDKLTRKKLAMVIANDVSRADIGFNSDHNAVTVVTAGNAEELPRLTKTALAAELVARIASLYRAS